MRTNNIQTINTAVNVMKHFVELSAKLLPYYEKITRNTAGNLKAQDDQEKIAAVYEGYKIDPQSSELLLDSNILEIILEGFRTIKKRKVVGEAKVKALLNEFHEEYQKLQERWNYALLN
jgi:VIT1/CCC1 family predicted Fe2+/Mn2+ transporter